MIFEILILILAIPTGYLIAWLCRDELVQGRKWFDALIILGLIFTIGSYVFGKGIIALTCIFIAIVAFISRIKSKDKNWTKKRV
ncbi:MAG: hypothetical protein QXD13_01450 [Candidatus Pacearchaeota archaeon]